MLFEKKIASGDEDGEDGGRLCLLDCKIEEPAHVFWHCLFNAFMSDTVRRAFGPAISAGKAVEPSMRTPCYP